MQFAQYNWPSMLQFIIALRGEWKIYFLFLQQNPKPNSPSDPRIQTLL